MDIQTLMNRLSKLEQMVAERDKIIAALTKENTELRAQLKQNSTNSHRPPSSDPPSSGASKKRKNKRQRKRSGRSRGGQEGHKGTTRRRVAADKVDHVEECRSDVCKGCGASLIGVDLEPHPERHQVFELPEVRPIVTEYVLNACTCKECGVRNKPGLPEGVSWSAFGPRVHALVVTLSGLYHLSRRRIQMLLKDWAGLEISLGAISDMEQRVNYAMAPVVAEAVDVMRDSNLPTGMDETGWRQAGERRWLWVAITEALVVFAIRKSRGSKVVTELVGEEAGTRIIITDRWSGYFKVPLERRQFCWAHLMRDFQKMVDSGEPEAALIGRGLIAFGKQMFKWWHQVRDGTLSRAGFQEHLDVLKLWFLAFLERGSNGPHKKSAGVCKSLKKYQIALWTFAYNEGVEPTNNHSERAIRQAVIWRKICFGTQSDMGALFVERILSIAASLQLQERNVFSFILDIVRAEFGCSNNLPTLLTAPQYT